MDIRSFTPSILCTSHQNIEVNLVSRSDTIVLGSLCNCTISQTYSPMSWDAWTIVSTGTRCTINVSQQSMTHT